VRDTAYIVAVIVRGNVLDLLTMVLACFRRALRRAGNILTMAGLGRLLSRTGDVTAMIVGVLSVLG
jgi:hypothetical protein